MTETETISFIRYLEAKKSVDNRSFNSWVWNSLVEQLRQPTISHPLNVIEAGAGIGTMFERMLESQLFQDVHYTGIDIVAENINYARARVPLWAVEQDFKVSSLSQSAFLLEKPTQKVITEFEVADILSTAGLDKAAYDLLVANAFMDLIDIPSALPQLFQMLKSDGLFYFSINFDGLTILEPVIDPEIDRLILNLYHRTMDERKINKLPSGDSHTGRHLLTQVPQAGGQILAAGASDWVVFPGENGYADQEACFLHFIIQTIYTALQGHAFLNQGTLEKWILARHAQIERSELVYIAHQIDILGKMSN